MAKKSTHKGGKGPTPHLRSRTTRSSKGRLVTSDANPNQLLSTQLSLLGLYAAPTIGDGNCLFRALSDQVHGSAVLHGEVRKQVCDWIEAHGERYEGFVEVDDGDESDSNARKRKGGKDRKEEVQTKEGGPSKRLQAYLRRMRENATYGGHMELSAFAHMMRRNIKVVQPGLVYVIEWRAGGSPSSSAPPSSSTQPESTPTDPTTVQRRRSTRTPSLSVSPRKSPKTAEDGKEVQKIRTGHGYYIYEEVTSDEEDEADEVKVEEQLKTEVPQEEEEEEEEEEEDGGPTIYVAYHDWEHFSSIRNLRGPHTGLPNIRETPPQTEDPPSVEEREREGAKEREREKKKERKEKSTLKVKLRVPTSAAATPPPSEAQAVTYTEEHEMVDVHPLVTDPSFIPLPTSRSASPFPPSQALEQPPSTPAKHPLSSSTSPVSAEQAHLRSHSRQPHLQGSMAGARTQYRSPKRTFDESSASGGEDASGREEKRSRMRMGSTSGGTVTAGPDADISRDMEIDADAEADTPGLSAPSSAASSSETSSEASSELSSASASPSPQPETEPVMTTPKVSQRYQHQHHVQGEKTLTRRQRKALGLPKQRSVGPPGVSAGKIVIPGGRWTGRPLGTVSVAEAEADEEWRRNGTGRLDVRGFRELKI